MTAARAVSVERGGVADLDEVMLSMEGFDPAWGEAWTRAQCQGLFGLPGCELLLARVDGTSAGFALSRTVLDDAELLLLVVGRRHRRRGIGRRLIEAASDAAAAAGAQRIHLEVRDGNPAQRLYTDAGFDIAGRRRGYYRRADGAVADALTLSRTVLHD